MKKIIICLLTVFWTSAVVSAAPFRNVLAHSSEDWVWVARVVPAGPYNPLPTQPPEERTEAFVRQNGPGQAWRSLPEVTGRAVAMASRSSQLVLLMSDGQWFTVYSDGSASGQPLPAGGKILSLADDGDNLWAIGAVLGGRAAADEAIVKQANSTQPTTIPVLSPAAAASISEVLTEATSRPALESSLVVFCQQKGRWKTFAELPHDASIFSDGEVSLAIVGGSPMVSYKISRSRGSIETLRWGTERKWNPVRSMYPVVEPIDDFKLFTDGTRALLWWTRGNSAGELIDDIGTEPVKIEPVKMQWNGPTGLDSPPAITFFGGFIRVLGLHGKNIFEQRYETRGTPVGTASELMVPGEMNENVAMELAQYAFLIAVAFSVGSSVYRQLSQSSGEEPVEPPTPAALMPRFGAGLIDLIPVIGVGVYLFIRGDISLQESPSWALIGLCAGAIGVYLLHTTVTELLTGWTIGKRICGLKVVSTDGQPANSGQIAIRNLLRVIDPLVMIAVSPLRQRSADVVAGTMVVPRDQTPPPPTDEESNLEPAEKDSQG